MKALKAMRTEAASRIGARDEIERQRTLALARRPLAFIVPATILVAASVFRFEGPLYVIENYTDHLRHEYSAWAFLHMGFDVFSTPLEDWSFSADYPHLLWPQLPVIYPPGLVTLFLPFGVASNTGLVSDTGVHAVMVALFGAAAVAASFQLLRTLRVRYEGTLAVVVAVLGTVLYLTWGLNGFVDPLVAGLALAGIYYTDRGSPGRALVLFSAALSIQFRLWYLWPVVLALVFHRWRDIPRWQLALSGFLAAVSLIAFALSVQSVADLDDIPGIETNYLAFSEGGVTAEKLIALCAGLVLLAVVYISERDIPTVASIGLVLVLIFGVAQWQAWYPVLLTPALALVRGRWAQVAITLAFVEAVFFLGGFPNVIRTLHLYVDAIR